MLHLQVTQSGILLLEREIKDSEKSTGLITD